LLVLSFTEFDPIRSLPRQICCAAQNSALVHREALATPGRPGVRVLAKQLGVNVSTVQRISRPFEAVVAGQ
jgi:DNA-binding transcriptional regulator YhcF (GntR family)